VLELPVAFEGALTEDGVVVRAAPVERAAPAPSPTPAPAAAATSPPAALPRTGVDAGGVAALGSGLVLLGSSLRGRRRAA
jgi:LPXTG-motif cell wall-anchored protein